jgi:hypothetical protein
MSTPRGAIFNSDRFAFGKIIRIGGSEMQPIPLTYLEQKKNVTRSKSVLRLPGYLMSSRPRPSTPEDPDRLEAAIDQAIAACDGNLRDTIRALILANEFLEI